MSQVQFMRTLGFAFSEYDDDGKEGFHPMPQLLMTLEETATLKYPSMPHDLPQLFRRRTYFLPPSSPYPTATTSWLYCIGDLHEYTPPM